MFLTEKVINKIGGDLWLCLLECQDYLKFV